jgi:hypothetical protein
VDLYPRNPRVEAVADQVLEAKDLRLRFRLGDPAERRGDAANLIDSDQEVTTCGVRKRRDIGHELALVLVASSDSGLVVDPTPLADAVVDQPLQVAFGQRFEANT